MSDQIGESEPSHDSRAAGGRLHQACSPLFRVFYRGSEVGKDIWANNPEHVDNHLFITRTGRVFWQCSEGMNDITADSRLELLANDTALAQPNTSQKI